MRVLFVEDNQVNRVVVRQMLLAGDIEMDEAENGFEGLRMVEANDYDLVLMDLRMPQMDGLTAIRKLRARPDAKASVPIVVITADIAVKIQAECAAAGANSVLQKPISMEQLFDTIACTLAEGQGDDALVA